MINAERRSRGLRSLVLDSVLMRQSHAWTEAMIQDGYLHHSRMDYGGEVVARGYRTARAAVDGWLNSPPHRAIILGSYSRAGFGSVDGWWTVQVR